MARIEEVVLATSGADPFELVLALSASRIARREGARGGTRDRVKWARSHWPWLELAPRLEPSDAVLERVDALLDRAGLEKDAEGIDALFEQLITRVAKGQKGQFWTPRHVVDFAVGALHLRRGERVADPACG